MSRYYRSILATLNRLSPEQWATDMVISYRTLNPEQAVWFDGYEDAEIELYTRLVGLFPTFKDRTVCDFIYLMQVSGSTTQRSILKTGATLRWDMAGVVENQNNLPAKTLSNNDFISVTSTDGWGGVTTFTLNGNTFKGACPNFNLPNVSLFWLSSNNFSGACPNFNLPVVKNFEILINSFSGVPPIFNFPVVESFNIRSNSFSGACPNFNFPVVEFFNIRTNAFTSIEGFDFVNSLLGNFGCNNNALNQSSIDGLLAAFVAANKTTGTRTFIANGGTNAVPSSAGEADITILQSRGWTVTVNT